MRKDEIVEQLATDLRPVRRLSSGAAIVLWLSLSWAFVIAITLATGDLRPGVFEQLQHSPRFVIECLLGFGVGVFAFRGAVLLALPGRMSWRRAIPAVHAMVALWIAVYVYGLVDPALEPSTLGYRRHCFSETLLFSGPPVALGLFLIARRTPIRRGWVGGLIGASAASLPALIMQIACMYDPKHILLFHLMPVVILGIMAGLLGKLILRKP
jgi:hypothetical protein